MPDSFTVHAEQYQNIDGPARVSHAGGDQALVFKNIGEDPEGLGPQESYDVEDRVSLSSLGQTSVVVSYPDPPEDEEEPVAKKPAAKKRAAKKKAADDE